MNLSIFSAYKVHKPIAFSDIILLLGPTVAIGELASKFWDCCLSLFREKEARQPWFPMKIGDRTFQLVQEHLTALGYSDGPLGLSCDDTKLFPAFRMYWDSQERTHFVVGGIDGPMRVANPDRLRIMLQDPGTAKATKVRQCQ